MASKLFDMLKELASNPQALEDFWIDPEDEMRNEYELAEDQIERLMKAINEGKTYEFFSVLGEESFDQFDHPDRSDRIVC